MLNTSENNGILVQLSIGDGHVGLKHYACNIKGHYGAKYVACSTRVLP